MRYYLPFLLLLGLSYTSLTAQTAPDFWGRISPEAVVLSSTAERQIEPLKYAAFKLDYLQMSSYLLGAPREFSVKAQQQAFQVVLPLANGKKETFSIAKTRVMAASLEAEHPEIGTYVGKAINIPGMQVRITVTPGWGFRAMVFRADKGVEYLEPVAEWQHEYYMAYDRLDLPKDIRTSQVPICQDLQLHKDELEGEQHTTRFSTGEPEPGEGEKLTGGGPVTLRVYRFACAATGEFSEDNGGTKELVFQKITTVVNQLNGIFERDINIRLELIAKSLDVIFLDPDTDPFTGTDVGGWMTQNPAIMGQYLGSSSQYDMGHVFGRYQGSPAIGIASLGSCCTLGKAQGCSSWYGPPYGDPFLGIAAHEMGHQWSAGHTFNQCSPGNQFSYDSACEPGGGSTLLSYNSCGDNNIDGTRYLIYHACSVGEVRRFVELQEGATCGTDLATTNSAPEVFTPYPNPVYIPISTPFELTGSATDPDGDELMYTWDEIDRGPTSPLGSPIGSAPLFRWFEPTASPTRTFPRIETIISNSNSITEVLPSYTRNINMVLFARDNRVGGGGVGWDSVRLSAVNTAGPFLVTFPNTVNIKWVVGEYQTVIWNVANTDKSPVNAKIVNIKLSTDNGLTYPITLAAGVPNNGKHCIQVPNIVANNMRIRVEAADNVFFDISNSKFEIAQPTAGISLCTPQSFEQVCLPGTYTTNISTVGLGGFNEPITLSATGMPAGVTATFSPNPVLPGNSSQMTLTFPDNLPETLFNLTLEGNASASATSSVITLSTTNNYFDAFGPTTPPNGATGVNERPALKWSVVPDAEVYDIELATNPSFEAAVLVSSKQNVVIDTFQVPVALQEGGVYYWRVRPQNSCGEAAWSEVQVFVVAIQNCTTKEATDLPKNISANSTPTVESQISIPAGGIISDINIKKIQGNHSFFKDLEAHLIGPSGTDVLLWKDKCASNVAFNFGFDDGAIGQFNCPPPNTGVAYKPVAALSAFNGQISTGQWTLRVKDNFISSGGSLTAFELEICSSVATNPPLIVINNPLSINSGTNAVIGDNLLKAEDPNTAATNLVFTLMTLPIHGQLIINGINASVGSQFTQADISNGAMRYYDYGQNLGEDKFKFSVTDGEGGLATGTYVVTPFSVGTHEPNKSISFDLAPNPASAVAVLSLSEPLQSDARVRLLNAAGQVVESWQLAAGSYSLRLDVNQLPRGIYAVSLEGDNFKGVKKLVIY